MPQQHKLTLNILIRSIIFDAVVVCSIVLGGITLGVIAIVLPYSMKYKLLTSWAAFTVWLAKVICNIDYKVINPENIPEHPCIVISNHQSAWETFLFPGIFPNQCWVVKKQLLNIPIWGWIFRMLKPISLDRKKKHSVNTLLEQGIDRIENGIWIIIFPEGTRHAPGTIGKYSRSGTVLAEKSQTPILPVAHNSGNVWPRASLILWPGTITVYIGKEILIDKDSAAEVTQQIAAWTQEKLDWMNTTNATNNKGA